MSKGPEIGSRQECSTSNLPDYERPPVFYQLPVGAEEFEQTDEKLGEVFVHAVRRLDPALNVDGHCQ